MKHPGSPAGGRAPMWREAHTDPRTGRTIVSEETLSNFLKEDRRFEPPAGIAEHANLKAEAYERAAADREDFWAEQASASTGRRSGTASSSGTTRRTRSGSRAASSNASVQLRRPSRRRRRAATRPRSCWEGEPGDTRTLTYCGSLSRGEPVRERAERPRRQARRPRRDLPAADSRTRHRHARLRAHRRRPQRWCSAASPPDIAA